MKKAILMGGLAGLLVANVFATIKTKMAVTELQKQVFHIDTHRQVMERHTGDNVYCVLCSEYNQWKLVQQTSSSSTYQNNEEEMIIIKHLKN